MGLASLITIPIGLVVYTVGMRDYPEKYGRIVATKEHMGSTIIEYINGIEVIKTFGQAASSYEKFTDAVRANSALMLDWMRVMLPSTTVLMNVLPAVLLGVLPIGCVLIMDGSLAPAKFVTIIVLSMGIIEPLFSAMMYTNDISKISTIMDELGSVLDQPEMQRPAQAAVVSNHTITLNDVTFFYHKTTVLKGINMTIAEGQTVALVGSSGSGKSTIAKLIASQWDVGSGSVCIGAVDVREMPSSQVSDMIAYVAQDNYLFDDTVMNNIRMGCPGASDAEVVACAQASGCHDFIMSLEQGYDTVVGGAGGHLSGGERQRVSIARAMMKDVPIVILDEATAYADPENEAVIQDAVAQLTRHKMLIVIAHRLSTITQADHIAVIDDGLVAGWGTHAELCATNPLYQTMWVANESTRDMGQEES